MMNEVLGVAARFQQLLTRKYGIIGGAPSPQLTPEITPDYPLPTGPEDRILASDFSAVWLQALTAQAGQKSAMLLKNASTGSLLVVEHSWCATAAAVTGYFHLGIAANLAALGQAPTAGSRVMRDTRVQFDTGSTTYSRKPQASCTWDNNTPPVTPDNVILWYLAGGTRWEYTQPIVLGPGYGLMTWSDAVNIAFYGGFAWREVPIGMGEVGPF